MPKRARIAPFAGWLMAIVVAVLCAPSYAQVPADRGVASASFDHGHGDWTALLERHVVLIDGGAASQVRYADMKRDREALQRYLASLSAVRPADFDAFTVAQQKAFLINAYNAFTIELVLTRYPGLRSITDMRRLTQTPWQREFVALLGMTVSLDKIEHDWLRARGRYDDPRIHFALNCASVGCPMLREEAFVADRLEAQLDEQVERFMSDRSRNRWNSASDRLEVSRIFDWYADDFREGNRGIDSVGAFLAGYAEQLADAEDDRDRIRRQRVRISYLDYDWSLNDASR